MLPIKKLYVDSRFKSKDSVSDTNFKVDLPQTLLMPQNAVFYIDDVSIPVSWYTIDEGRNNKFYFRVDGMMHVVQLVNGNHTITSLNNILVNIMNASYPNSFTASPNISTSEIEIACVDTKVFELLTDDQLLTLGYSAPLYSVNDVLRNTTPKTNIQGDPFISKYIDLFPIRNIYITSPNLGNFNTMSAWGDNTIIKKVPVTANYNEMVFDQVVIGNDYLDCSRQTLSRLEFHLKDAHGNTIDLHGNHWSFSIVFSKIPEEN